MDSDRCILRLTDHPAADTLPRISPDGRWVAFRSQRTGNAEIWKVPITGGEPIQLTDLAEGPTLYSITWHPDGAKLLFFSHSLRFWEVLADGSKQETQLPIDTPDQPRIYSATFSYDGSRLYTQRRCCHAGGDDEIYVPYPDGTGWVRLTYTGRNATIGVVREGLTERVFLAHLLPNLNASAILSQAIPPTRSIPKAVPVYSNGSHNVRGVRGAAWRVGDTYQNPPGIPVSKAF